MSALRILALSYLASASVFVVAATLAADPRITRQTARGADMLMQMAQERLLPCCVWIRHLRWYASH